MTVALVRPRGQVTADPILVVDDEPAVRALFARALQGAGYATLEAADGVEALELLDAHSVALVLLDSTMPRLDGVGVIRAVRARATTRTLPIILVTARAELEERVLGLAAGADDYLGKPVALDELEARVGAQLRSHAAWSAAFENEARQRRAMTSALRRVGIDGPPECVAAALVEELMPVLGLGALALASLSPDGAVIPLAVGGSWAGRFRLGLPVEPELARRLRHETARGPWVLEPGPSRDGDTRDEGVIVALPLTRTAEPFGLLVLRVAPRRDAAIEIARRMPIFVELADLTAAVLGPGIEAGEVRLRSQAALIDLIAARAFIPHFQPIVSLSDGAVVGYEALTRFDDGLSPELRFAEAGRFGLAHELERATLSAAVEAARALPADALVGFNVSPGFLLATDLSALLSEAGRQVVLEITEHTAIDDYAAIRAALARIDPPVQVAVDDAGSGYASLRHILALRPAYVKLDMDWVRSIDADPARQALVAGLVHFAAEVGCQLIGEGVETEAESATLRRLGVPLGQGYLFGRPTPVRAPKPTEARREASGRPQASSRAPAISARLRAR